MDKIAVFDIEAFQWTKFRLLGFYDGKDYLEFYSVPAFLDHLLLKKYRSFKIFAHFAGRYDFLFLLEDLLDREDFKVEIIEAGSRIIQLKVSKGKQVWYFQDSFALMSASLKLICESFGVDHMKQDFDHSKDNYLTPEGRAYLRNDVLGLYEAIQKYSSWGMNDGKLRMTSASQAMYIFRKNFLKERLFRLTEDDEEFIRKTYFGGRTEIFKMTGKNLNYYDVNSMYPFVMMNDFPTGKALQTKRYIKNKIGFYEILVNFPKGKLVPYIPYVKDGKLLFPVGKFTSFVTSAEISELEKDKIKYHVKRGIVFSDKKPIFRDYVKYFYELKKNSKKGSAENFISKLALNALYGKTGQKRLKETIIKISSYDEIIKQGLKPYHEKIGLYKKETFSESNFILPHLASYVTSLARMELYRLMKKAGFENVYYVDTDSVVTSSKLPISEELGGVKLEYSIKEAIFLQPKMYALKLSDGKTITRMKGFNNQDTSFNDFKKALFSRNISSISKEIKRMIGWKECLNKHNRIFPSRITQIKTLNSFYDKRIVNKDFSTKPLDTSA